MRGSLEILFKKIGIRDISHGVVYNIGSASEIKYWDMKGNEHIACFDKSEISRGIFYFQLINGVVSLL